MNKPKNKKYEALSFLYCIVLLAISILFLFQLITIKIGILNYIGAIFFLGYLYHFLFYLPNITYQKYYTAFLSVGLLSRVFLSFSLPLWEDDYARYLWEGNLISKGISPYSNPPEFYFKEISNFILENKEIEALSRINHPDWSAIYSPLVLLYFYLCALVTPFSLIIIKLGYILIDVLVLGMIQSINNKKSAVLYFLFPVTLKEIYINSHFEIIPIFYCVASFWLNKKSSKNLSSLVYGLAVHSKIYLIYIFPFFLIRNCLIDNKEINYQKIFQFFLFFLLGFLLPAGILEGLVQNNSFYGIDSLLKFANEFEFNSLYFSILKRGFGSEISRMIIFTVSFFYMSYSMLNYKKYFLDIDGGIRWCYYFFLVSLLFSPIVNAWYFLILIPLYLLAKIRLPFNWVVILIPQVSYLTFVNLNSSNDNIGFYNITDSIIFFEIISITGLIFLSYFYKTRRKN
jgi:hypothetical protein